MNKEREDCNNGRNGWRMMRLGLAFLMMLALSSAASCSVDLLAQAKNMQYVGVAISLVILLTAIAYVAGTTSNHAEWVLFAKDQLFHLAISAVLIISVAGILVFSCTVLSAFLDFALTHTLPGGTSLCYQGHDPLGIARCYTGALKSEAGSVLQALIRDSLSKEMNSAFIFGFYNPFTGGVMTPSKSYLKTEAMQLDTVGNMFVLPALISLTIQKAFFEFIGDFVKFLIPAALFFRVLPGFRKAGNLMIALAVALYILVPVLYALNAAMDDVVFQNGCAGADSYEDAWKSHYIRDGVMGDCDDKYGFWAIARFLPQAFFLPNLTLALTITFLSAINKALKVLT